jgi:hypothetical protein
MVVNAVPYLWRQGRGRVGVESGGGLVARMYCSNERFSCCLLSHIMRKIPLHFIGRCRNRTAGNANHFMEL